MNTYNKIMLLAFYAFAFICMSFITYFNIDLIIDKPITILIYIAILIFLGHKFIKLFNEIKW